jgi:protein-S-isoprenylcysteine O-methyltransferase Ste14
MGGLWCDAMNPWFAKVVILLGSVAIVVIRAPHGQRSRAIRVVKSWKGRLEVILLTLAWLGFFVPLIWIATPIFAFADYSLRPVPFVAGSICLALGLWLFYRSHADLGTNWSITLEVRDGHRLVTQGLYRYVRHPMYLALLLYSLGQALVLPNWVAGPSYIVAVGLLVVLRVGPEERMMLAEFGKDYEAYARRTRRLVPGVW